MSIDLLSDAVAAIIENADELKAQPNLDDVAFGQLVGYAEALCIIQDICSLDEQKKLGLDFDVDARYLIEK